MESMRFKTLILAVFSIADLAALPTSVAAQTLTPQQQLARDIYQELVEINTVTATGDTDRAAQAMAARLRSAGLPAEDVQVLSPGPRKGNLQGCLQPCLG